MRILKTALVTAALIAGASSLALAQNGPPTGGDQPIAGGAAGSQTRSSPSTAPRGSGMMHQHTTKHHSSMQEQQRQ